ncbi:MAG: hypothetical protein EMLJLAPB_01010 [Candidatus Argoarchaeum ethanivorans]|uniref:Uncharacterized protein n=1 Tax=Candidatus Argoarchaeum ethanivorans TaxID=2608793 RepID=A0A811TG82_9EURY|nr:MAG: hypothetical protein EMLJLAPB_01010 [Candidatus Argoarchaeum ethanivorans]
MNLGLNYREIVYEKIEYCPMELIVSYQFNF